jgi:hypothetical protein
MDLARAPRRTARKKGSGYENGSKGDTSVEERAWEPGWCLSLRAFTLMWTQVKHSEINVLASNLKTTIKQTNVIPNFGVILTWTCYGRDSDGRLGTRRSNILMTSDRNLRNNQLITSRTSRLAVEPDWHSKRELMHGNVQRWRLCGLWKCWNSWESSQGGLEWGDIPPHGRGDRGNVTQ